MFTKILAITALSLSLSGAALAQTDPAPDQTQGSAGSGGSNSDAIDEQAPLMPQGWKGAIADTFYTDSTAGTLRTEAEIRAGWAGLSAEQQAQVRADCAPTLDNNSAESNSNTEESASGPAMSQLCTMVNSM
jgi:hypothetical protein